MRAARLPASPRVPRVPQVPAPPPLLNLSQSTLPGDAAGCTPPPRMLRRPTAPGFAPLPFYLSNNAAVAAAVRRAGSNACICTALVALWIAMPHVPVISFFALLLRPLASLLFCLFAVLFLCNLGEAAFTKFSRPARWSELRKSVAAMSKRERELLGVEPEIANLVDQCLLDEDATDFSPFSQSFLSENKNNHTQKQTPNGSLVNDGEPRTTSIMNRMMKALAIGSSACRTGNSVSSGLQGALSRQKTSAAHKSMQESSLLRGPHRPSVLLQRGKQDLIVAPYVKGTSDIRNAAQNTVLCKPAIVTTGNLAESFATRQLQQQATLQAAESANPFQRYQMSSFPSTPQNIVAGTFDMAYRTPLETMAEFGISESDLVDWVANLRDWLSDRVFKPLASDFRRIESFLDNQGWRHLSLLNSVPVDELTTLQPNPYYSISSRPPTMAGTSNNSGGFFSAAGSGPAGALGALGTQAMASGFRQTLPSATSSSGGPPSSLSGLVRETSHFGGEVTQLVRQRLQAERYLYMPQYPLGVRRYLLRRIVELADGTGLAAYRWDGRGAPAWDPSSPTDAEIVMHVFSTWLDVRMPGTQPGANVVAALLRAPFTAKYVRSLEVGPGESLSDAALAAASVGIGCSGSSSGGYGSRGIGGSGITGLGGRVSAALGSVFGALYGGRNQLYSSQQHGGRHLHGLSSNSLLRDDMHDQQLQQEQAQNELTREVSLPTYLHIQMQRSRPPHYRLCHMNTVFDVFSKRDNLFSTICLFIYQVVREKSSYIDMLDISGNAIGLASVIS